MLGVEVASPGGGRGGGAWFSNIAPCEIALAIMQADELGASVAIRNRMTKT